MSGVAIVGASETTELGRIPRLSQLGLHADAARNALRDAGLTVRDVDGVATAGENATVVAYYLGIEPAWVDGTSVGRCEAEQVGVNAPGRANSSTFLPAKSSSEMISLGPSAVMWLSATDGTLSPTLIAMGYS